MFYQDLFTWLMAWGRSRLWLRMFGIALIPGFLFACTFGLVVSGALLSRQTLAVRYTTLVKEDVDASLGNIDPQLPSASDGPLDSAESAPAVDATENDPTSQADPSRDKADVNQTESATTARRVLVPLRRIMQLGNSGERVVYLVAISMAKQGRLAMAAQMLRDIAPRKGGGFPYAHAFLADYALPGWKGTPAEVELYISDVLTAERGGVKLSLTHLYNCADLLKVLNRKQEAIDLCRRNVNEHPQLSVLLLQLDRVEGNPGSDAREALAGSRAEMERKRKAGEATLEDVKTAVQLEMLDEQIDNALELARYGFALDEKNPEARRIYSSVLLAKHRAVAEERRSALPGAKALGKAPPPIDLRYLELACQIDSANPIVGEELANQMAMGQSLTPELKQALEDSLLDGRATGVTHLILANRKLMDNQPQSALPELRLALLKMPDAPIVMNNLAYAILKYEPGNLPEAKRLIERALQIPGSSPSRQASMFDTLAEIVQAEGDELGAIQFYEEAIKQDGSKLETRRKLAALYAKSGMQELADGQLRKIQDLTP